MPSPEARGLGYGALVGKDDRLRRHLGWAAIAWLAAALAPAFAQDQAGQRAGEARAALSRGSADQAVALFTEALAQKNLPSERRAVILTDRGVAHVRRNSPREALEDFNRAIQLYPEYAAIYNNRGNVLLAIGAVGEAMKDFNRALVLAPGYAAAFSNRASANMKLGRIDLAVADYTQALALVPNNPAALNGRGRAHLAAHRPHAAIRDFTRAATLDARFSAGYRGRAEAKRAIDRYDEAIEDFSRAIAFEAQNPHLYLLRGQSYLDAGNAASAIKDFTTAVELNPTATSALVARGFAHAKVEAFEDAHNDLARAIELEPRSPRAFAYRAWTYRQQRQSELGLKDVERALRLDANSPEAHWARGEIYELQERPTQAIADLKKALSLDPGLKEAARALSRLGVNTGAEGPEVAHAGRDGWRVFHKGQQYVATSELHPRLKIDLEMLGEGEPRILEWDLKKAPPFAGIGVLRFHAGSAEGPRGSEEIEQIAIVDVQAATVLGVETQRRGSKLAQLTWDDGRLIIVSADGVREELQLRETKVAAAPPPQPKRYAGEKNPFWSPWGGGKKSKSLFDLIFGN
jgi:tetratricopeptide (TPR) repeat protein